jgi:hypothetical protein
LGIGGKIASLGTFPEVETSAFRKGGGHISISSATSRLGDECVSAPDEA